MRIARTVFVVVRIGLGSCRVGRKVLFAVIPIGVFAFIGGTLLAYFIACHRSERTVVSLISGDRDVEIIKIAFGGEPTDCVVCENVEVCRYLSETLRTSGDWVDPQHASRGWQVKLTFSNGMEYSTSADVIPNGISMSIRSANPVEIGIPTHTAYFHEPVPTKVKQAWDFLLNYPGVQSRKLLIVPKVGLPYVTQMTTR